MMRVGEIHRPSADGQSAVSDSAYGESSVGASRAPTLASDVIGRQSAEQQRATIVADLQAQLSGLLRSSADSGAAVHDRQAFLNESAWHLAQIPDRYRPDAVEFAMRLGSLAMAAGREHMQSRPNPEHRGETVIQLGTRALAGSTEAPMVDTRVPKHIEVRPELDDIGNPPIPNAVGFFRHPRKFKIAGYSTLAGIANVVDGVLSTTDILRYPAAVAFAGMVAHAQKLISREETAVYAGLATMTLVGTRDFVNGATPLYRRCMGYNFQNELQRPNSEVARARNGLGRTYGKQWVKNFEAWARTPNTISLDNITHIAQRVMLSGNAIPFYPIQTESIYADRIEAVGRFLGYQLNNPEIRAVSCMTIVDEISPTEAMKKLYSFCVEEPDPLKIDGHFGRLSFTQIDQQTKWLGFMLSAAKKKNTTRDQSTPGTLASLPGTLAEASTSFGVHAPVSRSPEERVQQAPESTVVGPGPSHIMLTDASLRPLSMQTTSAAAFAAARPPMAADVEPRSYGILGDENTQRESE